MKDNHKCESEINFGNSTQILSKVINGYDREYCGCNAKYFESGYWYCGRHAPSKVKERGDKKYNKWIQTRKK